MTTRVITKSIEINASPDAVFVALTNEKEIMQWFANAGARFDARKGGEVEIKTRMEETGELHTVRGKVVDLVHGKKVSYSWSSEFHGDKESLVTWTLEPVGESKTRVTLLHSGLAEDERKYNQTVMGWSYFTGRLAEFCKDRTAEVIRKTIVIDAPQDTVFRAITRPEELTKWFPDQAVLEPKPGGFVQFKFFEDGKENHRVEGKVMELVPNERLVYSWQNLSDPEFPNTVVSWTLENVGGKTRVTLVHSGFAPKSKWGELHDQGWTFFVNRLASYVRGEALDDKQSARERGTLPSPH